MVPAYLFFHMLVQKSHKSPLPQPFFFSYQYIHNLSVTSIAELFYCKHHPNSKKNRMNHYLWCLIFVGSHPKWRLFWQPRTMNRYIIIQLKYIASFDIQAFTTSQKIKLGKNVFILILVGNSYFNRFISNTYHFNKHFGGYGRIVDQS